MAEGIVVLFALVALLGGVIWFVAGKRLDAAAFALIAVTAPLEVYRTPVAGLNISLFRLSVLAGLVIVLVRVGPRPLIESARRPVVAVYAALCVAMLGSLLLDSENRALGGRVAGQVIIGVIAVVILCALGRQLRRGEIVAMLVAAAALPCLAAVLQAFSGGDAALPLLDVLPAAAGLEVTRATGSFVGELLRLKGTFGDPNHFGAYLALTVGPALWLTIWAARRRDVVRAVGAGGVTFAMVCVSIASLSRTAWIVLAVTLIGTAGALAPTIVRAAGRRTRVIGAVVFCVLLAGTAAVAAPIAQERLGSSASNSRSNDVHTATLNQAARDLRSSPLTGVGLSNLGPQLHQDVRTSGAHSTYLTVGAEMGLIGLALLFGGIGMSLNVIIRGVRRAGFAGPDTALLAAYVGFIIASAVYDLWWDDFQWVFLGAMLATFTAKQSTPRQGRS